MLDLILIIIIVVSLFKPDVLLAKKIKEKANDEQKEILTRNLRKTYSILVALLESLALMRYENFETIGLISGIIFAILVFKVSIPAGKENRKIINELK